MSAFPAPARIAAAAFCAAVAMCAFAVSRQTAARRIGAEAAHIRAELVEGPLAAAMAEAAQYDSAVGALVAAAAARPAGSPAPGGAVRPVRGTALRLASREERLPGGSAAETLAALDAFCAGGDSRIRRISLDALPGGRFRATAAVDTFFLP